MKNHFLHILLLPVVLFGGFSISTTRANLVLEPLKSWEITGDFGEILSLKGVPVSSLIVGTSVFADPPGASENEPAGGADDFSLYTAACADGQPYMQTVFGQGVTTIFMLEKKGNDSGSMQGLDAMGDPMGNPVAFSPDDGYFVDTGYLASYEATQQQAFGTVITSDVPIYGLLITAPGIDPVSISAVPEPATVILLGLGGLMLLRRRC